MTSPIGYYVHHHGTGHLRRAQTIIQHITRPVVLFSSLPQPADLPKNVTYVRLSSDVVDGYVQSPDSAFHYTPYAPAIFERNQQLIDAWRHHDITDLYVDVSIEVALLAKLYGLRVGHAVMHGDRRDAAHSFGYQAVDYLLDHNAPQFDSGQRGAVTTPVFYAGGIARYKRQSIQSQAVVRNVAVTVSPASQANLKADILGAAAYNPDVIWHVVGQSFSTKASDIAMHGVVADPFDVLSEADVIIGSGGNNTIMEAASLGKPFICLPEDRPYDEQIAAARSLATLNAAVYLQRWPEPDHWPDIWARVQKLDLAAFHDLVSDEAAQQAAAIIEAGARSTDDSKG